MTQGFSVFEEIQACPVCGSSHLHKIFSPTLNQCEKCRVIFRSPRPSQAEIKRSYDQGDNYRQWDREADVRQLMWEKRGRWLQRYASSGDLLDIGCGDGTFLDVARTLGFRTQGTEISDVGADAARAKGHHVVTGQFVDLTFPPASFDLITMWHVLEHVPDPGHVLEKVHRLLRPNGLLIVAVPNEENFLFRHRLRPRTPNPLGEPIWGGEIHLTHFQPATLRQAFRCHGFKIEAFGVDDIYFERSLRNSVILQVQKFLAGFTGWHFSMAMYAIGRREDQSSSAKINASYRATAAAS
jgi:2-polyprenyl-3-methyl-5-hydroxy-6-metoxy-1,4-benzoquinol methylase